MKVLVIGGGAIGCTIAWRLAQRGLGVTLVERGALGGEATSAAAGILAPQAEAHAPGPLYSLTCESRARWPGFADELQRVSEIDVGYRATGTLMVPLDETEELSLRARLEWQRAAGQRAEWTGRGLYLPDDHQVDPRLLARALATAAARAGVVVHTGSARRLLGDGQRISGALVDETALEADQVVLAGGAWTSLVDGLPPMPRVRPLRGQLLELRAAPDLVAHVTFGDGGYLVPRADGRILVGSSEDDVGFVKSVTPPVLSRLLERALKLEPRLAGAEVLGCWAGLRPATGDRLPLLGRSLPGLQIAAGHYRNGILLAPLTAEIVAAGVTGQPPPVALGPFSPARPMH
jgi:glycine oxidase